MKEQVDDHQAFTKEVWCSWMKNSLDLLFRKLEKVKNIPQVFGIEPDSSKTQITLLRKTRIPSRGKGSK